MRKIIVIALVMLMIGQVQVVFAAPADVNKQQTARVTVGSSEILAIEFAAAADNVGLPGGGDILWTNIDPSSGNLVRPTNHTNGKLDTGVVVKHNSTATNWFLKMAISGGLVVGGESRVKYYLTQPINKNTGTATNGTTVPGSVPADGSDWPKLPTSATTRYTSNNDTVNTPFGTLVSMDVALDPQSLVSGTTYTSTITFTATVNA